MLFALFLLQTVSAFDPCTRCPCQCGETSQNQTEEILSFNEGQNVTVIVEGDFSASGCKFLFYQKVGNVTCCYIDIRRHENNQGEALCGRLKEPESCREKDTYYVREIDGWNGFCSMTLFDGKRSDSGEYQIIFPEDPYSNTKRIIEVKKVRLHLWEILLICLAIVFFIIVAIVFYKYIGRSWLIKREKAQRDQDTIILDLLQNQKTDDFKKELGTRSILGLRDLNYNNIFHRAARKDWTDDMTKTVLEIVEGPGSLDEEMGRCILKKNDIFHRLNVSSWSNLIPDSFPGYLIPKFMLHLTINLNSRNEEGNTPLILLTECSEQGTRSPQSEARLGDIVRGTSRSDTGPENIEGVGLSGSQPEPTSSPNIDGFGTPAYSENRSAGIQGTRSPPLEARLGDSVRGISRSDAGKIEGAWGSLPPTPLWQGTGYTRGYRKLSRLVSCPEPCAG